MRVLLVDNLVMSEDHNLQSLDVHPHLGLLALAAAAEGAGHSVSIYDPKRRLREGTLPDDRFLYDTAAAQLLDADPDVVGFTALGASFLFAVNVGRRLKIARPDLRVLLGGPHATMLDRNILAAFSQFDVIVRHEADVTFPMVLAALSTNAFEAIPGLTWRTPEGTIESTPGAPKIENLDDLPLTRYDLYPIEQLDLGLMRIEAGRGCPFACTFCSTAGFFQRSYRLKSPERLVAELDCLHDAYGVSHFKLDHDMFTANRKKVLAFCNAVQGRPYRWRVSARVDCVDRELLEAMSSAGCVGIYFGIETGSQRLQTSTAKRLDLSLVEPILHHCHALGIETTASFICGFPDEEAPDLGATLDLIGSLFRIGSCLCQLHMLAPEPGTPLFASHGDSIVLDDRSAPYHCRILSEEDRRLVGEHREIFQTYYHFPTELRPRQLFAITTVDLFRHLGSTTAEYLLRFFSGRLSCFVDQYGVAARWRIPSFGSLLAFLSRMFGERHHLVSLVRYAAAASEGPESSDQSDEPEQFDGSRRYRLGAGVMLLDEMHDCAALLDDIETLSPHETMPPRSEEAQTSYFALPAHGGRKLWKCDRATTALMSLFAGGDAPREVIARYDFADEATSRTLEELSSIGALRAEPPFLRHPEI